MEIHIKYTFPVIATLLILPHDLYTTEIKVQKDARCVCGGNCEALAEVAFR